MVEGQVQNLRCLCFSRPPWGQKTENRLFHKNRFSDNLGWNWGGLQVSRVTAQSIRSYMQNFSRFGLAWHRKVNFSTFSGKLTLQSTRNGPQNLPFCPGPLQDTFIIFPRYLTNIFFENMFQQRKRCSFLIIFVLTKWLLFFLDFPRIFHGGRGSGRLNFFKSHGLVVLAPPAVLVLKKRPPPPPAPFSSEYRTTLGGSRPPPHPPTFFVGLRPPDNSWEIHGKSMGPHGDPWAPMRNHGFPWVPMGPMGSHGFPWVPMGPHGFPWGPHGLHETPRMSEIMDFNETHNSVRQNVGSTGSISIRNMFPLHPVTSKRPESPYGATKTKKWQKIKFVSFSAYRTPIGPL